MSRCFRMIVFDWDGTLADSASHIVACVQGAAADIGWEPRDAAVVRNIIGLGMVEACEVLYPEYTRQDYQRLADAYRRRFFAVPSGPSQLFEGAMEVLESLSREGYLLAIATGKSRAGLRRALRETGLGEFVTVTRCADETASKPHPQMLFELMEEMDVTPGCTVMVGDTEYDMAMARNAGVAAVGVGYGAHEPSRLLAYQPLACLEDITQLLGVLEAVRADSAGAGEF